MQFVFFLWLHHCQDKTQNIFVGKYIFQFGTHLRVLQRDYWIPHLIRTTMECLLITVLALMPHILLADPVECEYGLTFTLPFV